MGENNDKIAKKYHKNRHGCYMLRYHLVLMADGDYITDGIQAEICDIIRGVCDDKGVTILELKGGSDFMQLYYECGPELSPLELANVLKTKTARLTRRDLPDQMPEGRFWGKSYLATTSGDDDELVWEYLQEQHEGK